MAIRIDENTIFEDGRMKKISEVNAETNVEAETKEEPKSKAGRKPKVSVKGKEA